MKMLHRVLIGLLALSGYQYSVQCVEECGDECICTFGGAYGCVRLNAPPGTAMECCSVGQTESDCNSTTSPLHPLPFCPYGYCSGEGCVRTSLDHPKNIHCTGPECDSAEDGRAKQKKMTSMKINQMP
eukprot:scpid89362/ scgid24967/ 